MKDLDEWFDDLESDCQEVLKDAANKLKEKTTGQIKLNFRRREKSNFFKQVRTFVLPAKGSLPPVAYVRLGADFMHVFEEGAEINPGKWMMLLLPTAPRQFKRITKGNTWESVKAKYGKYFRFVKKGENTVVLFRTKSGEVPVYLLTKKVQEQKLLSFFDFAEEVMKDVSW
jgi:Family of unknown function (DUF6441)